MKEVISQWNQAAKLYSDFEGTSPYSSFCRKFVSNLFKDLKGLKVLDAGCGNGIYVELLTENGGNVVGCDGSEEMLNLARTDYPHCQFDCVDLHEKLPYKDSEFDIVLCNLVLMDIDPIDNVLAEFYRILKTKGIFFFSIMHPAFYLGNWEKEEQGVRIAKKIPEYIKPVDLLQNNWGQTMHYHRPISYYYNQISACGFNLKSMFEPNVYESITIPDFPHYPNIPMYLFSEFTKLK